MYGLRFSSYVGLKKSFKKMLLYLAELKRKRIIKVKNRVYVFYY